MDPCGSMPVRILFCLGILCSLLSDAISTEPPTPRNGEKIVIINDDGFSKFYGGHYKTEDDLRRHVLSYADTQLAVFEWCIVGGSRVNFPSPNHKLLGEGLKEYPRRGDKLAAETLQGLKDKGVDTLAVVASACNDAEIACYASIRMNGDYSASAWEGGLAKMFNSDFWRDHLEFRQHDTGGKPLTRLSYAFPEVREFKLGFVREAVKRDIDGINLDFQRHPTFFSHEKPMVEAFKKQYDDNPLKTPMDDSRWDSIKAEFMTAYLRETRAILDEAGKQKGRRIGLSLRIDWQKYKTWGCDIETWIGNGWIDYLVVGQYGLGGYSFDISPFVEMAEGSGCAVLFGEECILDGHDTTAKEDKLIAEGKMKPKRRANLTSKQHHQRASQWYKAGADGVHLFNLSNRTVLKTIGSFATAPSFEEAASIRDAIAVRCDWGSASAQIGMGIFTDDWEKLEEILDADEHAVMCQGAAYALHMKYKSLGFRSYLFGLKNSEYSHAMCLIEIQTATGESKLVVMDPSFNISFTDKENTPLSVYELIKYAHRGDADEVIVVEGKPVKTHYLQSKIDPTPKSQAYRDELQYSTDNQDVYSATVSLERFANAHSAHITRCCEKQNLPVSAVSATFGGSPTYVYCTYPMSPLEKRDADGVFQEISKCYSSALKSR